MNAVRRATNADVPRLAHLWHEKAILLHQVDARFDASSGARTDWTNRAMEWLQDARCAIFVSENGAQLIGYAVAWRQPGLIGAKEVGLITDFALDTHTYEGGAGRRLFKALRNWFGAQGIKRIVVCVPRRYPVEQAFWRSIGAADFIDMLWIKP
jgi:GNAT superfamily N-acetyltransferase